MEKRLLLAVVLSLATLVIWYRVFPPPASPKPATATIPTPTPAPGKTIGPVAGAQAPAAQAPTAPPAAGGQAPAAAAPTAPPAVAPEQTVDVGWPDGKYRAVMTTYGAALKSFELLDKKYLTAEAWRLTGPVDRPEPQKVVNQPTNLVSSNKPVLWVRFRPDEYPLTELAPWRLQQSVRDNQTHRLSFVYEAPEVEVKKTLVFTRDRYDVPMTVEVRNKRQNRHTHHLLVGMEGYQNLGQIPNGFFSSIFSPRVAQNEAVWDKGGKYYSANLETLTKGASPEDLLGNLRWIGIGQQYFLMATALRPDEKEAKQGHAAERIPNTGAFTISAEYAGRDLDPVESWTYPMTFYAGPKLPELLDVVTVEGAPSGLSSAINYTLEVLARPLLWILRQIYNLVHSWALAIVLLTVLVKLVTYWPTHKSMQSMKAMAELKPEIDALKEKCGDDKQRFNTEMMGLYRKHGVNPLGGCLPMLLQMPIWFALYSMLGNAVELYRVPFLWIQDLTAADPYLVLPLITGGLMYLQTKLSPAPPDPQQKAMVVMMPIMFTIFSLFLPAGLTLYIMTNTVLGMLQQVVINRTAKKRAPVVAAKPAPVATKK